MLLGFCFTIAVCAEGEADVGLGIDYPRPTATLQNGSKGDEVHWLQTALNLATDANLTVDGDFGNGTADAVRAFQEQNEITPDGIVDQETIDALVGVLEVQQGVSDSEPLPNETVQEDNDAALLEVWELLGIDESDVFHSYWSFYFRTIIKTATIGESMPTLKLLLSSPEILKLIGIMLIVLLMDAFTAAFFCIFIVTLWDIIRLFLCLISPKIQPCWHVKEPGFWRGVLVFILIIYALFPAVSDAALFYDLYSLEFTESIWRALLYSVMRFALAIAVFYLLRLAVKGIVSMLGTLPRIAKQVSFKESFVSTWKSITSNKVAAFFIAIPSFLFSLFLYFLPDFSLLIWLLPLISEEDIQQITQIITQIF